MYCLFIKDLEQFASVRASEMVEFVSSTGEKCCVKFPRAVRILEAKDIIRFQIEFPKS